MELSLNSFLGLSSSTTTKLWGSVGKQNVKILIDSGATHNFLDPSALKKAHLTPVLNKKLNILLGTDITMQGTGVCKAVFFSLPTLEDVADFIVLELGRVDMVLGCVPWDIVRLTGRHKRCHLCSRDAELH